MNISKAESIYNKASGVLDLLYAMAHATENESPVGVDGILLMCDTVNEIAKTAKSLLEEMKSQRKEGKAA